METYILAELLQSQGLNKIDALFTENKDYNSTYYFLRDEYVLLFQPYKPLYVISPSIGFCDRYYLAFQKLYAKKNSLKEKLKESGILTYDFKGQYKRLIASMGLGKILRNTLLWLPNAGTFFAIEIISIKEPHKEIFPTFLHMDKVCLHCKKCIEACPTGALTESGFIRENCIRQWQCDFLSPESSEDKKRKLKNKILGCNICQSCCPQNSIFINSEEILSQEYQKFFELDVFAKNCIIKSEERAFYNNYLGENYMRPRRILSFVLNAMENDTANLYQHYCAIKQYVNTAQDPDIKALIKHYVLKWENTNDFN